MPIYIVSEQVGLDGFWITDILKGIKAEADKKNLRVEDYFSPDGTDDKNPLVLAVGYTENWMKSACRKIKESGARPIAVNAMPNDANSFADAFVGFDYNAAMVKIISYLRACGKRKIAFIGCRGGRMSYVFKSRAFSAAVRDGSVYGELITAGSVAELTDSFIKRAYGFDAVICSRDAEAVHLMSACKKRKIYIPDDMFCVSFGGGEMCEHTVPTLTAMHTDFEKLGASAVKLSRFLSQNPETDKISILLDCPMIIRQSTDSKAHIYPAEPEEKLGYNYRVDNDYMSYLRAEQLVRTWDKIDVSIVRELSRGYTMAEIADRMFISQSSVKYRVKKMLTGADIENRQELIKIAQNYGLL